MNNIHNTKVVYIEGHKLREHDNCWIPLSSNVVEKFFSIFGDIEVLYSNQPKAFSGTFADKSDGYKYYWDLSDGISVILESDRLKIKMTIDIDISYDDSEDFTMNCNVFTDYYNESTTSKQSFHIHGHVLSVMSYLKCFGIIEELFTRKKWSTKPFENRKLFPVKEVYYFDYLLNKPLEVIISNKVYTF